MASQIEYGDRMSDGDALLWHIEKDPRLRSTILVVWLLDRAPDRTRFEDKIERDFEALPRVRCHAGQLNQAFLNLLMNACDAIGDNGRITVRTRTANGQVRLEFEDDGPGIPADVRDRVFEPFYTTKPVGQGTGLGLSLTHGIIERHAGRIWVESERGLGTRFVIELPIDGAAPAAPA